VLGGREFLKRAEDLLGRCPGVAQWLHSAAPWRKKEGAGVDGEPVDDDIVMVYTYYTYI